MRWDDHGVPPSVGQRKRQAFGHMDEAAASLHQLTYITTTYALLHLHDYI